MRMSIIAAVLASLAPAVSAQHSVNCWGKASHAPFDKLITAVQTMDRAIYLEPTPLGPSVRADKNDCHELWCVKDVSIRFCNEDTEQARSMPLQNIVNSLNAIMHDCATTYKGEKVAGGVVDHPDKWSVVVQMDDQCKPASY